jgi:SpoVK/Ycf46/Vps4 family AAA+-type ATPase
LKTLSIYKYFLKKLKKAHIAQISLILMTQMTQMDPLLYNNCVLTHNIAMLSNLPIQQLVVERDKIKKEFEDFKKDHEKEVLTLKRKLSDAEYILKNEKDNMYKKPTFYRSRFESVNFYPNLSSWSPDKVNEVMRSIKSIDDIIKLKPHWFELRHNLTLQRLHYLITPLTKLNSMVGLEKIKSDIFKKIIYWIQNSFSNEYLHTIISGPPGVGKTEFAKIYADIFVRLGILKTDKFIEIKRDDLVGEYLGQTAPKTRQLLESAMGGVLFLDEAYSLGNKEKRDSFSKEAIDMINQYLSERKGEFMFIIAGYEDDMNSCLFGYNKGMRRRFHSHYKITGYEPNELKEIFNRKVNQTTFNLNVTDEELNKFFIDNKSQFLYFGGDIEKFINEIKQCQSLRAFNANLQDKTIILEDMKLAITNLEEKDDETPPPINMYL